MTNEIAIRYCDEYLARNIADIDKEFLEKAKEALQQQPCEKTQMVDKSNFSQEQYRADLQSAYDCGKASVAPCDDAISRQAVLDLVNADWKYEGLEEPINSLPPVNPQEPCSNCCNGNQIEKAKLCQKSYLAGMEHKQEPFADTILTLTKQVVTQVTEDIDNFIFTTIKPWCEEKEQRIISKRDLEQALTQYFSKEPCADAISRQAVLEYIEGSEAELGHSSENELVCQYIKELPPVTPQQKDNIKGFCEIAGNLTNGDVIKALFPNASETDHFILDSPIGDIIYIRLRKYQEMRVQQDWWNAPYKKAESEEEK